jgi:hypothetical protein
MTRVSTVGDKPGKILAELESKVELLVSAGTPSFTGKGVGSLCIDYTNGVLFIQKGTVASNRWDLVGTNTYA